MTKITLEDVASFTNEPSALATVNSNSSIIETASDNFLSRDGTSPNEMLSDLDMNSKRVFNLPTPATATEALRLQDLTSFLGSGLLVPDLTNITVTIKPLTNDGAALGTTTKNWSDLFLASGAVINWNAGDVTLTHSANQLTFAGASSGYTFDTGLNLATGSALSWNSGNMTLNQGSNSLTIAATAKNVFQFAQNPGGNLGGTYIQIWPGDTVTSQNTEMAVISSLTNAGLSFRMKGTGVLALHAPSDQSTSAAFALYENEVNGTDRMVMQAASSIASSFTLVWPGAVPTSNTALVCSSGGALSFNTSMNTQHGSQFFVTSGTFTPAAGVYTIYAEAWGGGGGGGWCNGAVPASGGGGGGYSAGYLAVSPGSGVTVTIGAGGAGGTGTGTGTAGGTTTFSTFSVTGGGGGGDNGAGAGAGGVGSGSTIDLRGGTGSQLISDVQSLGGAAPRGGLGGVTGISSGAAAGGNGPGGGGGGGSTNGASQNGGAGANGGVLVWW